MHGAARCEGAVVATAKACPEGHFQQRLERNGRGTTHTTFAGRALRPWKQHVPMSGWNVPQALARKQAQCGKGRPLGREQGREIRGLQGVGQGGPPGHGKEFGSYLMSDHVIPPARGREPDQRDTEELGLGRHRSVRLVV